MSAVGIMFPQVRKGVPFFFFYFSEISFDLYIPQFGNVSIRLPLLERKLRVHRKIALLASKETALAQIFYIFNVKLWVSLCR